MNLLPGWHPGIVIAGASQAAATIALVASSVSVTTSITIPVGVQAGDLLVIWHIGVNDDYNDPPPSDVTPSGFTPVGSDTASVFKEVNWRASLHWKMANGTEGGTSVNVVQGQDGFTSPNERSICAVFRRTPAAVSITAHDPRVDASSSGSGVSQTTIDAGGGVVPLVALDCVAGAGYEDLDIAAVYPTGAINNPASGTGDNPVSIPYYIQNFVAANQLTSSGWSAQGSVYFEMV